MQADNLRPPHTTIVWTDTIPNINVACCEWLGSYFDDVRDPFVTQAFDKSVDGVIQSWNQHGNLQKKFISSGMSSKKQAQAIQ